MKSRLLIKILICILAFQLPASAFWGKSPLPRINPQEKINYVNINWWDNFSDPYLKEYIVAAIKCNHDAKQASWKTEEYRQFVKYQFSQELPSISVGADYILNHMQDLLPATKSNIFAVPFTASYEADIFGKNHDKTKSSKKTYEASKFDEEAIYISLASNVATVYINTIKFDKQIELQEKILNIKGEELKREEARYKRGVSSMPVVNDYKKDYESAKNALEELVKSRDKSLNQLAVLIGDSPENSKNLKRNSFDKLVYKNTIPKSIDSDAVFARPDIKSAEATLEKSKIDVKVARKEFLPRINIIGVYSFTNLGSGGFGSWSSTLAALAAGATLDLFKGGQKVANLKINKARYEQMFEKYRQTDLNAIKEVNDSLLIIKHDETIDSNSIKNFAYQQDNYQRSKNSYKSGVISYPQLLKEQEKYIQQQQNTVNTKSVCFVDYITLYKAVGGNL